MMQLVHGKGSWHGTMCGVLGVCVGAPKLFPRCVGPLEGLELAELAEWVGFPQDPLKVIQCVVHRRFCEGLRRTMAMLL